MYVPKYFKVDDVKEIKEFVQKNSFGTIVTTKKGKPIATHLPLGFYEHGDDSFITGHMAYGNSQWKTIEANTDCLVMFQGPHAYVSSSWYNHENVPTWNYQAVHIYGIGSILNETELKQELITMLQKYENHRPNSVSWEKLSSSLLEQELKGIVGFKIKIKEIQAAYKLSQNRNTEDYSNIIKNLKQEEDLHAHQLAEVMQKFKK